jgi:hypothetical protein
MPEYAMSGVACVFAVVAGGWLGLGCVPAPDEETVSLSQAIGSGSDEPPDPPPLPPVCEVTPGCVLNFAGGFQSPLQSQLHCTETYTYYNGSPGGRFLGGLGSFCRDTSFNRNRLRGYPAFLPGYCATCLDVPTGWLFVFWQTTTGPQCPSSCSPTAPIDL